MAFSGSAGLGAMLNTAASAALLPALLVSALVTSAFVLPARQSPLVVTAAPTIDGVSPYAGPITGGTRVTIVGIGFSTPGRVPPVDVAFGSTPATSVVLVSDTQITAISPNHVGGVVDVRVTNTNGTSAINAADRFTYTGAGWCALFDLRRVPTTWTKGHTQKFYVYVFNCGVKAWPATGYTRVDINMHFATQIGTGYTTSRYWLTQTYHDIGRNVAPNRTVAIAITLTPTFRGNVVLEGEMIKLHQFWFGRYLARPFQFSYVNVAVS